MILEMEDHGRVNGKTTIKMEEANTYKAIKLRKGIGKMAAK